MKYVLHWPSGAGGDFILGTMMIAGNTLPDTGIVSTYTGCNRWNILSDNSESMHSGGIDGFEKIILREEIQYIRTHRLGKIIEKLPLMKEVLYSDINFKNINIYCGDASELYYVSNLLVTKTIINMDIETSKANKIKNPHQFDTRAFFNKQGLYENFMGKETDAVINFRYRELFLDVDKTQIENLLLAFDIDYSASLLKSIREAFNKYALLNQGLFILDEMSPHTAALRENGRKVNCRTLQDVHNALDESIALLESLGINFNKTHLLS